MKKLLVDRDLLVVLLQAAEDTACNLEADKHLSLDEVVEVRLYKLVQRMRKETSGL